LASCTRVQWDRAEIVAMGSCWHPRHRKCLHDGSARLPPAPHPRGGPRFFILLVLRRRRVARPGSWDLRGLCARLSAQSRP
jgi:hypothetical protein